MLTMSSSHAVYHDLLFVSFLSHAITRLSLSLSLIRRFTADLSCLTPSIRPFIYRSHSPVCLSPRYTSNVIHRLIDLITWRTALTTRFCYTNKLIRNEANSTRIRVCLLINQLIMVKIVNIFILSERKDKHYKSCIFILFFFCNVRRLDSIVDYRLFTVEKRIKWLQYCGCFFRLYNISYRAILSLYVKLSYFSI